MIGQCQKVETLSDGSVKLSVYVQREQLTEAAALAFNEISIVLKQDATAVDRDAEIAAIRAQLQHVTDRLLEIVG